MLTLPMMGRLADTSEITAVVDYCGAGGESQGLVEAGITVIQAANHSEDAIETHAANHASTDHLLTDLLIQDPRVRPRAHIYQASPECTWHSPAGGRKRKRQAALDMFDDYVPNAAGERSRATMMTVLATAEAKRFPIVIVENVVEVADWEMFEVWMAGFAALGYEHQILSVSAAHVWSDNNRPAPQWRDRVYFVFYLKGIPFPDVSPRPLAFCPECEENVRAMQAWKRSDRRRIGKYRQQYDYVCPSTLHTRTIVEPWVLPAIAALDMTDLGDTIGSRKRPIAEATLRRGWVGRQRIHEQLIVAHSGHTWDAANPRHKRFGDANAYYRAKGVSDPLQARMAGANGDALMSDPFLMAVNHGGDDPREFAPGSSPLPTRSTKLGDALVTPFVTVLRRNSKAINPATQALATVTAGGNHHALVTPDELDEAFLMRHYGSRGHQGHLSTSLQLPMHPITKTGGNHSLVIPYRKGTGKTVLEPLPTATTVDWAALATGAAVGPEIPPIEQLRELMAEWKFRMLKWREHANAQRFPRDYIFTGNSSVNTLLAGNAVATNVAMYLGLLCRIALGDATAESLGLDVEGVAA